MNRSLPMMLAGFACAAALATGPLCASGTASSAGGESRSWAELPPADRDALAAPTKERWERATPEQRRRMLDRARFWASLRPEQKQLARSGVERYRDSNAQQRTRLRDAWRRLQSLPPEQREALQRTWQDLSPRQRRAWLEAGGPGVAPPPPAEN